MHFPQPAFLRKGCVLKVVWLNYKICCDVVADHLRA